ncbi:GrpB family protein [Flexivirga caeni]|uniref:GrpB family protein n=1 Tax=Flexivirga caeni TaxID=2294115 RepID=UPI001315924D|nr:GrpB family protein [Flexivirga caeni]
MEDRSTYPAAGIIAYDPAWTTRYDEVAAQLAEATGGWHAEHIGSTSVPGLAAKPVIDIAVCVPQGRHAHDRTAELLAAGWTKPASIGSHDCCFLLVDDVRTAIAHFFPEAHWDTAHQRLFAQWLREHPSDRDVYAALKIRLHQDRTWGRAYTRGKTAFIQRIVDKARAQHDLPPIPIWDKD